MPNSYATSQSVTEFEEKHLKPTMMIDANFYIPEMKASFNKSLKITFPEFMPVKSEVEIDVTQKVKHAVSKTTSEYFFFEKTSVKTVRNWYDGSITYEDEDPSNLDEFEETGYYYEGIIPSPNQICDLIAYQNGWTFNYVFDSSRQYECGETVVNAIYEEEFPNVQVNSSYELGALTFQQQIAQSKSIDPSFPPKIKNISSANLILAIEDLSENKFIISLGALIAIIIGSLLTGAGATLLLYTLLDPTPYSQKQIDEAHYNGYMQGVNESLAWWEQRLLQLLADGILDNTTYTLLQSETGDAYPEIMSKYVNPYADLGPGGDGGDSWFHSVLSVLGQAIIITIIVIVVIIIIVIIFKAKGHLSSSKSGGSGTVQIIHAAKATQTLRAAQNFGLSTGTL